MSSQYPDQYQPQYQPQQHQPPRQACTPPAAPPQPAASRPKKRKGSPLAGCLALTVLAAIVVVAIVVATSGGGGSWKAVVRNYVVINPADLAVTVRVTNTGSSAETPTCTVDASDPSGAYSGIDQATLQGTVAPGATANYVDNVTITGQGAAYVTSVTVSC